MFKLAFQGYIDDRFNDISISQFPIEKGDNDIRAVWDARSNGLNETIWDPPFPLPIFLEAEDMVVKWLLLLFAMCLSMNSPLQDYSRPMEYLIK